MLDKTKAWGFFYSHFTPTGFGGIEEIESALCQACEQSYEVKTIRMSPQAMIEFQKCVIKSSTGVNSYMFSFAGPEHFEGGFLVNGYRDKYSGRTISVVVDGGLTDGCFVLDPDVSVCFADCECPKCKPPEEKGPVVLLCGDRKLVLE